MNDKMHIHDKSNGHKRYVYTFQIAFQLYIFRVRFPGPYFTVGS